MAGPEEVKMARKAIARLLNVRFEDVEFVHDDTHGGLLVQVSGSKDLDQAGAKALRDQLEREIKTEIIVDHRPGKPLRISVTGGIDMDSAIERLAKFRPEREVGEEFPGR